MLANHNSGRLLLNLQLATPIQTELSDDEGQKQHRTLSITCILLLRVLCKHFNKISGPYRGPVEQYTIKN